ncbi:MAG: chorismate mutase [Corynebacterium sp.]|nr:chorismate mutase [Corynebacterium sp.]
MTHGTGTDNPDSSNRIAALREDIDRLDRTIIAAVKERSAVSQEIGRLRRSTGGVKLVNTREVEIINHFRDELGEEGPVLAALLLRMGRGKLG